MPCLFILGPIVALIESDKDQPVRNTSNWVLEECEKQFARKQTDTKDFGGKETLQHLRDVLR